MPSTGPCAINICKSQTSIRWKKVTKNVIEKGQINNTLPSYILLDDTICLNCYNGIVTKSSVRFQQHAHDTRQNEGDQFDEAGSRQPEADEAEEDETTNDILQLENEVDTNHFSFSKVIKVMAKILYNRENKEKKLTIYSFDEFRSFMEEEDERLKFFFC